MFFFFYRLGQNITEKPAVVNIPNAFDEISNDIIMNDSVKNVLNYVSQACNSSEVSHVL